MNVFGYVWSNGAGSGYGGDGDGGRLSSSPIESYIIEGAGYYLAANADVQKLLRLVELQDLQGIDYTEMTAVIDSVILNMFNAAETYEKLIETAEADSLHCLVFLLPAPPVDPQTSFSRRDAIFLSPGFEIGRASCRERV